VSFYVQAENGTGVLQGEGPLDSAISAEVVTRLSKAGTVKVTTPATDSKLVYLKPTVSYKPVMRIFATREDGLVHIIGTGPVQRADTKAGASKAIVLSGPDQLAELLRTDVGTLDLSNGSGGPLTATNPLTLILGYAVVPWTFTGVPSQNVYYQFAGENVFAALVKLSQLTGDEFRKSPTVDRQIEWLPRTTAPVDSGVRIIPEAPNQHQLRLNDEVCLVKGDLAYTIDFTDVITRIHPTGTGNAGKRLTLSDCTRVAPAGYVLDTTNNYISYTPSEPTSADIINANISFKDITTSKSGTPQAQSAANTLYDVAKLYLDRHLVPNETYTFNVVKLAKPLLVGQTIFVDYQGLANGYLWLDIQKTLLVTEITEIVDGTNVRTVKIAASTANVEPVTTISVLKDTISRVQAADAHAQPAPVDGIDVLAASNTVYAGPTAGPSATANFRAVVEADLPSTVALTGTAKVWSALQTMKQLLLSDVAGTIRGLLIYTSGVLRWSIYADGSSEAGSDAGSDFRVVGTNDAGSTSTTRLYLKRSNGFFGVGLASTIPASLFQIGGAPASPYVAKAGAYTLTATDHYIEMDATAAPRTATLPTAVGCTGREYGIKRANAGTNAVTVACNGAETIEGAATATLSAQWSWITVKSNGSGWRIISKG
jgi:hypothetical protein